MTSSEDPRDSMRKAAGKLAVRIAELSTPGWQPQPHQVPPAGDDWAGWLLLAGRGAGKTDACAHYIAEHIKGPACLPGPTPHWIGIIAPTLGDAATSCYGGPSGIRAHSPGARLVNRPGGLSVLWPDGSEAKLFGANSPEDVERLRSGGNRCIAEGTLIRTELGLMPIEEVREGDRVWTRNGLRRVLRTWDNGVRDVRPYQHAAGTTWMTPDHEVWTDGGWKQASFVQTNDTVFTWANTESPSPTTASTGIPALPTPTTGTADAVYCIGGCGSRKWGPYRPGCRCITRTTTSGTTGSTTSLCSDPESTGASTETNAARTGTARVAGQPGAGRSSETSPANDAGSRSRAGAITPRFGTARRSAAEQLLRHEHRSGGCAACAAQSSSAPPATQPVPVHASALRNSSPSSSERRRVFDLTVEHDHEFFAGDLLVSNCISWLEELAAWRYLDECWNHMRFGLRAGPHPRWIASTTPKPRPLIKKLNDGKVRGAVISRASYNDNAHLPVHIREALEEEYGGTQLGRQELYAEVIEQDENALWTRDAIEAVRVTPGSLPKFQRVTVGVDPSGGAGEQGIVVSAKAALPDPETGRLLAHGFVLADHTVHLPPVGWARRAVQAAIDFEADDIVVERNYGGDMAIATVRSAADYMGVSIPVREVLATRGKRVRAEPVSALTEQGRYHFAGNFPALEDQLCTWTPESGWSPDRLDAMVWGAWHNKVVRTAASGARGFGNTAALDRAIG